MGEPLNARKGWVGSTFYGEWMRLEVHNIHGLRKDEWFLSCSALRLDAIMLKAKEHEAAKLEALKIAARFCTNYRRDLAVARFALEDDGFGILRTDSAKDTTSK